MARHRGLGRFEHVRFGRRSLPVTASASAVSQQVGRPEAWADRYRVSRRSSMKSLAAIERPLSIAFGSCSVHGLEGNGAGRIAASGPHLGMTEWRRRTAHLTTSEAMAGRAHRHHSALALHIVTDLLRYVERVASYRCARLGRRLGGDAQAVAARSSYDASSSASSSADRWRPARSACRLTKPASEFADVPSTC